MKVYFLSTSHLSFVRKDLEILESAHEVRAECNYRRALDNLPTNLAGVLWADAIYCWFASIHFFPALALAKLFKRRVIVVAGGYEVVNLPEIGYGSMRGGLGTILVRTMLRWADLVITISESTSREALENGRVDPARLRLIYHGFEPVPEPTVPKEKMAVTVGEVTWSNLKRKGLEDFVRLGARFPDVPFKLIGKWTDDSYRHLQGLASHNVDVLGFVDDQVFADLLSRAKVYVQASAHEGFGCSVAEAMLYKCVPVVRDVFALPEVVGECGFRFAADGHDFDQSVRSALECGPDLGEKARQRVVKVFPLSKRRASLLAALQGLAAKEV